MSPDKTTTRPRVRDPRLDGGPETHPQRPDHRLARKRMWRRRRRAILVAVVLLVLSVAGVKVVRAATNTDGPAVSEYLPTQVADDPPASSAPEPSPTPTPEASPSVTQQGTGKWTYAKKPAKPQKFGEHGTLLTFNVAVEGGTHAEPEDFSEIVTETLADERGWTAGDEWRFTRTGGNGTADFTVYLASPKTRAKMCGANDTYTSCRNGNSVIVNLERWLLGVPHWTESLTSYRQYVVNHEVGHRLGQGHVQCPKKGKPSPVMAQQTIKLKGCEPNAWPYVDGKYISGPPGEYL